MKRAAAGIVRGLLALGVLVAGCVPNAGPVVVRGKIFYHGAPVPRGLIVFTPDVSRGANGPLARGDIQSDGSYELFTEDKPTVAAGWYRITIVALADTMPPSGGFFMPRSLLPEKYRDPELSGLSCEVKAGQANRFDFNLD